MQNADDLIPQFRKNGFIVIPGFVGRSKILTIQREIAEILDLGPKPGDTDFIFWRGALDIPERIEPIVDKSVSIKEFCNWGRLIELLTHLLGEVPVLLKDKVILAPPGWTGYDLHQDYVFYPFCSPDLLINVALAIDATTQKNGALSVFSGQTDRSFTRWVPRFFSPSEQADLERVEAPKIVELNPGDIIVFHSLTPHRSGGNTTKRNRRVLYLNFNAASAGNFYEIQRARFARDSASFPGTP